MNRILYFASLGELLGVNEEYLELPAELRTIANLVDWLSERDGSWKAAFSGGGITILSAVNQEIAELGNPIADGDEIAFFPPVTGG